MASVEKRILPSGRPRWDVRYRLPGNRDVLTKTFKTAGEAKDFRSQVEADAARGLHVDPRRQKITVADWCDQWLAGKTNLAATTRERYEGIVQGHIRDQWAKTQLGGLKHAKVQAWLAGLDLAPASVRKIHRVFSQALDFAVKDGRLATNPARGVSLPRVEDPEKQYLTHVQVEQLAEACGPSYRLLVLFLAYTGLRWGEMAALKVSRLDFRRRRVLVAESITPVRGVLTPGPTKGHERREVPMPRHLVAELKKLVKGRAPSALLFPGVRGGEAMRSAVFRRGALDKAAKQLGLEGFTPHSFRHTAASLAIAAGADVKVVQTMLGHKSATLTLDLYGHLFPDRLDEVADAMETARVASLDEARKRRAQAAA